MNTTTTEDNWLDRKRDVELYLAEKGISEEQANKPEFKSNGWFFWMMTFITWGVWWIVFRNFWSSTNQDMLFKWIDDMLETKDYEEHEAKLEAIKGNQ